MHRFSRVLPVTYDLVRCENGQDSRLSSSSPEAFLNRKHPSRTAARLVDETIVAGGLRLLHKLPVFPANRAVWPSKCIIWGR